MACTFKMGICVLHGFKAVNGIDHGQAAGPTQRFGQQAVQQAQMHCCCSEGKGSMELQSRVKGCSTTCGSSRRMVLGHGLEVRPYAT